MTPNRRHASQRPDPLRTARLQRDSGMERARSITKGIAFGSVAAVAVAGVYLSQALPGHTSSSGSSSTAGSSSAGTVAPSSGTASPSGGTSSGAAPASNSAPSSPAYTPAPAYSQRPVVSSGSS